MILIDANILIAFDNTSDVHHKRAMEIMEHVQKGDYGQAFITDYVFNEIIGVTFRKIGKERSVFLGKNILHTFIILNIDDYLLKQSWDLFSASKTKLNLVDCTNVIVTRLLDSQIATFDKEFLKVKDLVVVV